MATHSSVLAWRIPGMGEPGGLPSLGSHRVGHDWRDLAAAAAVIFQVFSSHVLLESTTWDSADIEHVPVAGSPVGQGWPGSCFWKSSLKCPSTIFVGSITNTPRNTIGTLEFYLLLATHALSYLFELCNPHSLGFPGSSVVKNLPAMREMQVWSLGQEDPLEEEMATHFSFLAWEIPWRGEPRGLWSKASQKSWTPLSD